MLTPSFDITQDDQYVILTLRVPYVKASDAEFHMNGTEFKFYCKPYFLRLHLPGMVTEDGRERAVFDIDKGIMTVHIPKLQSGEHFYNLGMLTALLSRKPLTPTSSQKPLIEVLGEEEEGGRERSGSLSESEADFDWLAEQGPPEEHPLTLPPSLTLSATGYGFANQHNGVFSKLQEEIPSIIDCPDPDHMTSYERRLARITHEECSFNPDHYLADLMDNDQVETLLKFEPVWKKELIKLKEMRDQVSSRTSAYVKPTKTMEAGAEMVVFSPSERETLKDLPNKDYLLDKASCRCLYLGLIDIIFAFAYNHRTTEGEANVESAWTICKLSPTLSWLEVYRGSVHDVVYSCIRRSLCYPLYRHWELSLALLQDTRDIFRLGRRKLLQCLISIRDILNSSDPYYVLNNLYLTDYCVWVQKSSIKQIQLLADDLNEVCVLKESLGFELEELETAARQVLDGDPVPVNSSNEQEDGEESSCSSGESSGSNEESSGSSGESSEENSLKSVDDDENKSEGEAVGGLFGDSTAQELLLAAQQNIPSLLEQLVNLNICNEPQPL